MSDLINSILDVCKTPALGRKASRIILETLFAAHRRAGERNQNLSKAMAVRAVTAGGDRFNSAVIAAVASMGGQHAPVWQTRNVWHHLRYGLTEPGKLREFILTVVEENVILPGWGNSFYKDKIDPAWQSFDDQLREKFSPKDAVVVRLITQVLHQAGKTTLYPNAALYTAIAADLIDLPHGVESLLVLMPRLPVLAGACGESLARAKTILDLLQ